VFVRGGNLDQSHIHFHPAGLDQARNLAQHHGDVVRPAFRHGVPQAGSDKKGIWPEPVSELGLRVRGIAQGNKLGKFGVVYAFSLLSESPGQRLRFPAGSAHKDVRAWPDLSDRFLGTNHLCLIMIQPFLAHLEPTRV
jgi:hypothetical protein